MNGAQPRLAATELTHGVSVAGPVETAIGNFANAVVRARTVDPLTTEIVRLRCAQIHDCRICGSLRIQDALDAGFDEAMQRKIARYEDSDFPPAVIAALRLCDAIIMRPDWATPELKAELHAWFSDEQIAEICLDVMKWSQQKALVALRMEKPPWDVTTVLTFDQRGAPIFGGPVPNNEERKPS